MFTAAAEFLFQNYFKKKNLILLPSHSPNQKERQFFKKPMKPRNRDLGKPKLSPKTVLLQKRVGNQIPRAH